MSAATQGQRAYVVFQVERQTFVIDCDDTIELVKTFEQEPVRVPHAPESHVGIVTHRGVTTSVIDFRKLMGLRGFGEEISEMAGFVAEREKDHVSWLEDLRKSAQTGAAFSKATDPRLCAFGKWYESVRTDPCALEALTNGNIHLKAIFEAFDRPHRKIHGIAEEVLALAKSGRLEDASTVIDDTWNHELAEMRCLFKTFHEVFALAFKPMAIVLKSGDQRFALYVDRICSVTLLDLDEFRPIPTLAASEEVGMGTETILVGDTPYIRLGAGSLWGHITSVEGPESGSAAPEKVA